MARQLLLLVLLRLPCLPACLRLGWQLLLLLLAAALPACCWQGGTLLGGSQRALQLGCLPQTCLQCRPLLPTRRIALLPCLLPTRRIALLLLRVPNAAGS
jgi:hypothetical protein